MSSIFLSHTGVDKPIVDQFFACLRHYDGISCWYDADRLVPGDDLLKELPNAILNCSHFVVFWSKNAAGKHSSNDGIGDLSYFSYEIRTAIFLGLKMQKPFLFIRLDDTPFPLEIAAFALTRVWIDADGMLDMRRADHHLIVWKAVNALVGRVRGAMPISPSLELVTNPNGKALKKLNRNYFQFTWFGGGRNAKIDDSYVDSMKMIENKEHKASKVPVTKCSNGISAYRFSLPNHSDGGWWSATLFFGRGGTGWRTVDISKYSELRFDARADTSGAPLAVSFIDDCPAPANPWGYHETSQKLFTIGDFWRSGSPFVLKFNEIDWSKNGSLGNSSPVEIRNIYGIVFNNGSQNWKSGARWIEIRSVVIL